MSAKLTTFLGFLLLFVVAIAVAETWGDASQLDNSAELAVLALGAASLFAMTWRRSGS